LGWRPCKSGQVLTTADGQVLTAADGQVLTAADGQVLTAADGQVLRAVDGQAGQVLSQGQKHFVAFLYYCMKSERMGSVMNLIESKDITAAVKQRSFQASPAHLTKIIIKMPNSKL
jgi:hypothetical protein